MPTSSRTGNLGGATLGALPDESETMIELQLPDMTCGHCVKTVTTTVQKLDPAAKVECDLAEHQVRIDTTLPRERVVQALAIEGYPAA